MYGRRSHIYLIHLRIFIFVLINWQPWWPSTITGVIKRTAFVYFITFKFIYLKSGSSGTKSKAIISHDWCAVLGLYFTSSGIWQFFTDFEEGRMLESVGINFSQDYRYWVKSQMVSNAIYEFKFKTWNLNL